MKPCKMKNAELCFIFHSAHSVLYFPLENIVPEILLSICCNKPVKVPLSTLVHYGKYCTQVWSLNHPLCNISYSALAAVV